MNKSIVYCFANKNSTRNKEYVRRYWLLIRRHRGSSKLMTWKFSWINIHELTIMYRYNDCSVTSFNFVSLKPTNTLQSRRIFKPPASLFRQILTNCYFVRIWIKTSITDQKKTLNNVYDFHSLLRSLLWDTGSSKWKKKTIWSSRKNGQDLIELLEMIFR